MKILNVDNVNPLCPHCEEELAEVLRVKDQKGLFQGRYGYCYMCPHCRKVLGFADYSSS
jgi:uncharacterized protein with PIN domain